MKTIRYLVQVAALCIGAAAASLAQGSPCLSQPDSVAKFMAKTKRIFEYADSASLVSSGVPWVTPSQVQFVSDSATCAAAVAAFNAAAGATSTEYEAGGYVFSLGGVGYAFVRPGDATEYGTHPIFIFSPQWIYKGAMES